MRRLLGLAYAALIILSACGREPTPIEPTTKASASGAAPSAGANSKLKPPTLPAAAKRNDETGAANFVAYWVKVANFASASGDTSLLREVSSPECDACSDYADLYERTHSSGGFIRGGADTLEDVTVERGSTEMFVRAHVISAAGSFKASASSAPKSTPAEDIWVIYATRHGSDGWEMTQIGLDK